MQIPSMLKGATNVQFYFDSMSHLHPLNKHWAICTVTPTADIGLNDTTDAMQTR